MKKCIIAVVIYVFIFGSTAFGQDPFLGEIRMFGGNFAPRGWAFCEGQLLAISGNEALFSILGTTYGGDGRTTFELPDLRGRAPVHHGAGPGLGDIRLGEKGGSENFIITSAQLPSHHHTGHIKVSDDSGELFFTEDSYIPDSTLVEYQKYTPRAPTGTKKILGVETNNTGGGQSISKRSPYQGVSFIIALEGVFPSRN